MTERFRIDGRLGTFDEVCAGAPARAPILEAVRAVVSDLHPDAFESASTRERSVSWGYGPSKTREWYAYAMPHRAHVNLGFFRGIHLPDPEGLLEGTGKVLRHVKLHETHDARRPAVRALLSAARDERARALNLDQGS
jgi:hypothetical protein